MDATEAVTEQVDRFAGLDFVQACEMLFGECKSNAPVSEGFQAMIDFIKGVHESAGVEFSPEEYWNPSVFSGNFPVFPPRLGEELNIIPEELTREYLEDLLAKAAELDRLNSTYRTTHERVANRQNRDGRPRNNEGHIDPRALQRSINSSPVFLKVSDSEEEDDFI